MASLIKWLKDREKNVENVARGVEHAGQAVVAQVNPFDNGRTYNTVRQKGAAYAPQAPASVIHQATHNGATNVIGGGIVKPLIRTSMALNQGIGNAEVGAAHLFGLRPDLKVQNASDFYNNESGLAGLRKFTGYTGTKRQLAGDALTNAVNIAAPGSSKLLEGGVRIGAEKLVPKVVQEATPQVVKRVVPKVISNAAVGAPVGALSNTGAYISSGEPLTKEGLIKNAVAGAKVGAIGGAALPVAGEAARFAGARIKPVVQANTPDAIAHKTLLKDDPAYAAVNQSAMQKVSKINELNRAGKAVPKYLNSGYENDLNTLQQMRSRRSQGGYVGGEAPKGKSLPNDTSEENLLKEISSSANRELSSKPTITEPSKPVVPASLQNLVEEAKMYKTPEEFVQAYNKAFKEGVPVSKNNGGYFGNEGYRFGDAKINLGTEQALQKFGVQKFWKAVQAAKKTKPSVASELQPLNPDIPSHIYGRENLKLYRGVNSVNKAKANPNRPVYHTNSANYAGTYGKVSSKNINGRVATVEGIHGYEKIADQVGKYIDRHVDINKLTGNEVIELRSWLNRTLYGDKLSRQFNKPMPESIKKSFKDAGIDYIRIPGTQFDGTVGKIGHQTEVIEIPKPASQPTQAANASSSVGAETGRSPAEISTNQLPTFAAGTTRGTSRQVQSDLRNVSDNQKQPQEVSPPPSELAQKQGNQVVPSSSNSTPKRGFVQSVNQSGEVSPTVAKRVAGTYERRSTNELAQKAEKFASGNLNKATEAVSSSLARKKGAISDREIANAIAVAKRHDANKNYAQATDIYENLSKHLTAQGQAIQSASLLDRRTPEGIRYQITKAFNKYDVKPSKEVLDQIDAKVNEIRKTKPGTPERVLATKELQKIVADNLPSNISDKAIAFWKAGLLSGVRTQTGNLLSNETFSVLHNLSNPLAVALDKAISLGTKERTKALTGRGLVSGTTEGAKQGVKYLKTGIDERSPLTNKFETRQVNFKNKALNTYVNGVFRLMGAADRPHYYRQLQNSLNDLAIADGKTKGLKGTALRDHVSKFVENPPNKAFNTATAEAEKAVLGNETILSRAVARVRQAAEDAESPLGKALTEATINVLMPFTKVPSAFISRVIDYTPAGAMKTIASQISRKQFDQRALVTALSEATTGTAIMYLGSKLAEAKLISGNYPTDPKEQQRWKAQGIQPNSIKVGNSWLSMNYLGPAGLLFAAGARVSDAKQQGESFAGQQLAAYAGMPKDLTEQSFLQGLNNSMQAINEPGRYAKNFVNSQAGSIIPTLSNDIATATDQKQRQTDTPIERIQSRIPGAREKLKPSQDVYGNELARKTSAVGSVVNPLRPSDAITNSVKSEVARLHDADPFNKDLQVTPTPVDRTVSINGKRVPINNKQRYDLQKQIGQSTQNAWGQLIKTPEYKALDDTDKAKALNNLRSDITTAVTRNYVEQNKLGTYNKDASAKVQALSNGTANLADYASGTTGMPSYGSSPDAEYKAFKATYDSNVKAGKYNAAQKIAADKKLAKLEVGKVYPKDVRDLYNLSKSDLYDYLTTDDGKTDKKKIADQLKAYDKALYNAGLISYMKFRTGLAPAKGGRKSSGKSSKSSSGRAKGVSTTISKLSSAINATKLKPLAKPAKPNITVKTSKLPAGYRQTALKKYTVTKVKAA